MPVNGIGDGLCEQTGGDEAEGDAGRDGGPHVHPPKAHLLGCGEFEDFVDVAVQRFGAVPIERRVAGYGVDAIATSG